MPTLVLVFALLCLMLALTIGLLSRRARAATGLPRGRVLYVDTRAFEPAPRPLFAPAHGLTGKPDYLVRSGSHIIPVEVKSGRAPQDGPYDGHILQLAAYCLLVEHTYGTRPPYGLVHYPTADSTFAVDYTPALEHTLLATLAAMRAAEPPPGPARSHHDPARCQHCGVRAACTERLT